MSAVLLEGADGLAAASSLGDLANEHLSDPLDRPEVCRAWEITACG